MRSQLTEPPHPEKAAVGVSKDGQVAQGTYMYAARFMITAQVSPPFVNGSSTRR
jgi:hypothetical protein